MDTIRTIDAEKFKNSVFITIGLRGLSFKKLVRDQSKVAEYYAAREQEAADRRARGEDVPTFPPIVSSGGSGGAVKATKTLLLSPALDALRSFLGEAKGIITNPPQYGGLGNPSGIMDGLFELHKDLVPTVNAKIADAQEKLFNSWTDKDGAEHPGYVVAFLADYSAAIERARTQPILEGGLGPLFEAADYPSEAKVRAGFGIVRRWIALGVPEGLPPELREQAAEELRADLRNAAETIKDSLAQGLSELLNHAREVLDTKPGEKQKVIKESLIGNVLQFCEVFRLRNTQGDEQLAALVEEAKTRLAGVDPEKCRKFAHVRSDAAQRFSELAGKIDTLITERRTRRFDLEEETAPAAVAAA